MSSESPLYIKKNYLNGEILVLNEPKEYQCKVNIFRNSLWWIVSFTKEDTERIATDARSIHQIDKTAFNHENKLFITHIAATKLKLWNASRNEIRMEEIPTGSFAAKVNIKLERFTNYNNSWKFKLECTDVMLSDILVTTCPFSFK